MIKHNSYGVHIDISLPSDIEVGPMMSSATEGAIRAGGWEQCERVRIGKFLPDLDVLEMGAGAGFISCFTNKMIVNRTHVVLEANPLLIPIIEHHKEINNSTFTVLNKAYSSTEENIGFWVRSPHENIVGISHAKAFDVPAISISKLLSEYGIDEYSMVMDIEGGEIGLVNEAEALKGCKVIIIEMHPGNFAGVDVPGFLLEQGFTLVDVCGCPNWVGVYQRGD